MEAWGLNGSRMNDFRKMWKKKFSKKEDSLPESDVTLLNVQKRGSYYARPEVNMAKLQEVLKRTETGKLPGDKEVKKTRTGENKTKVRFKGIDEKNDPVLHQKKELEETEWEAKTSGENKVKSDGKHGSEVEETCCRSESTESDDDFYETVDYSAIEWGGAPSNEHQIETNESIKKNDKLFRGKNRDYEKVDMSPGRYDTEKAETQQAEKNVEGEYFTAPDVDYEEVEFITGGAGNIKVTEKDVRSNGKQFKPRERDYEEVDRPMSSEIGKVRMELDEYAAVHDGNTQITKKPTELKQTLDECKITEPTYMMVDISAMSYNLTGMNSMETAQKTPVTQGCVDKIKPESSGMNAGNVSFLHTKGKLLSKTPELKKLHENTVTDEDYAVVNKESNKKVSFAVQTYEKDIPPSVPNKDKLNSTRDKQDLTESKDDETSKTGLGDKTPSEELLYDLPYSKMETHALKMAMLTNDGDYSTVMADNSNS